MREVKRNLLHHLLFCWKICETAVPFHLKDATRRSGKCEAGTHRGPSREHFSKPTQTDLDKDMDSHSNSKGALWNRLHVFAVWGTAVGLVFFAIYPATNWIATLRTNHYNLYWDTELAIPFCPFFVWPYLSMYGLFFLPPFFLSPGQLKRLAQELIVATSLAGIIFLILPAHLGFDRILPSDPLYRMVFTQIFFFDHPHNLAPSLHVAYSTAIVLSIAIHIGNFARYMLYGWLIFLALSTLLIHQHHLIDVISGAAMAVLINLWRKKI